MPAEPMEAGSARDWLRHARSDSALAGQPKARNVLYAHLCFHAQQAAEKALKAVLVANGVRVPKTHDLAFLMQSLPGSVTIPPTLIELPALNRYAVLQRYPTEAPAVARRDQLAAVRLAEESIAWASHWVSAIEGTTGPRRNVQQTKRLRHATHSESPPRPTSPGPTS